MQLHQRHIGPEHPPYICGEMGVNHLGDLPRALRLIAAAHAAGADSVKFQKRSPRLCVPESEWNKPKTLEDDRIVPYIEYREMTEFGKAEYDQIDAFCKARSIPWFASSWDLPSLEFMEAYNPPCHKLGSPSLTDTLLLQALVATQRPLIVSTGMSTWQEIESAMLLLTPAWDRLILCHCTSEYPTPYEHLNLRMITTLKKRWPRVLIGYSGHERGTDVTLGAIALGACFIERHFTDNRFGWGTDQPASIEAFQMENLVTSGNRLWLALGDGQKQVYPSEQASIQKLRKVQ